MESRLRVYFFVLRKLVFVYVDGIFRDVLFFRIVFARFLKGYIFFLLFF